MEKKKVRINYHTDSTTRHISFLHIFFRLLYDAIGSYKKRGENDEIYCSKQIKIPTPKNQGNGVKKKFAQDKKITTENSK